MRSLNAIGMAALLGCHSVACQPFLLPRLTTESARYAELPELLLPSRHPPFDEVRLLRNELCRPPPATWLLCVTCRQFRRGSPIMPFPRRMTLRHCLVPLCLRLTATGALCFKFLPGRGKNCLCPL